MGAGFAKFGSAPVHVVIIGLDAAGKTTVLYRLKYDQFVNPVPTIGFNCEKVKGAVGKIRGVNFMIWDVGGQDKVRPLWRSYIRAAEGIVYVIDSGDVERMEEARVEMHRIARSPEGIGVPMMVLANKQDLPTARSVAEVERSMDVRERQFLSDGRQCCVVPVCAVTGEGLNAALERLYEMIRSRRKTSKRTSTKR